MLFGIGVGASGPRSDVLVERAITQLASETRLRLRGRSDLVSGPGVQVRPGAWFTNAAVVVETALFPRDLLRLLHAHERRAGRVRALRNSTRTLDLDLLWSSGARSGLEELTLPHPRLHERAFALAPLREVLERMGYSKSNFCIR